MILKTPNPKLLILQFLPLFVFPNRLLQPLYLPFLLLTNPFTLLQLPNQPNILILNFIKPLLNNPLIQLKYLIYYVHWRWCFVGGLRVWGFRLGRILIWLRGGSLLCCRGIMGDGWGIFIGLRFLAAFLMWLFASSYLSYCNLTLSLILNVFLMYFY